MARIKYGGIITDISGSVGGSTFQKSLFGNTLRNKPIPHKSTTPAQLKVRSYMMQIHAAWTGLSNDQRLQWNRFINFSGQTIKKDSGITMTGHDLFIKYNMFRVLAGLTVLTIPTYVANPSSKTFDLFWFEVNSLFFRFSAAINPANQWFILKLSSEHNISLSFSYTSLLYFNIVPASGLVFYITDIYRNLFGTIPGIGSAVNYSIRFFSTLAPVYSAEQTGVLIVPPL